MFVHENPSNSVKLQGKFSTSLLVLTVCNHSCGGYQSVLQIEVTVKRFIIYESKTKCMDMSVIQKKIILKNWKDKVTFFGSWNYLLMGRNDLPINMNNRAISIFLYFPHRLCARRKFLHWENFFHCVLIDMDEQTYENVFITLSLPKKKDILMNWLTLRCVVKNSTSRNIIYLSLPLYYHKLRC